MEYSEDEQYRRASIIIDAVCKAGKVSYCDFLYSKKSLRMNIVRGVASYLSWEYGVHARRMARLSNRSRCNILNQSKRYRYYIRSKDQLSLKIYCYAKEYIQSKI